MMGAVFAGCPATPGECGPETCDGCCQGAVCVGGNSAASCGQHGRACDVCVGTQVCGAVSGQCEASVSNTDAGTSLVDAGTMSDAGVPTCTPRTTCLVNECGTVSDNCTGSVVCPLCGSNLVCLPNNRCGLPLCENGVKDQGEGDVDCGGPCAAKCGVGQSCNALADCDAHATCDAKVCLPGRWAALPPLPAARANAAGGVRQGQLYVFGGVDRDGRTTDTTFIFNGTSWDSGASMPLARQEASVVARKDGSLVVIGGEPRFGQEDGGVGSRVDVYTPTSNSWARLPDLPRERASACTVELPDGRLVVLGGYEGQNDSQTLRSVAVLAPDSGAWVETENALAVARSGALCQLLADGGVFLAGGITTGTALCTTTTEVVDPSTFTSHFLAPMPRPQAVPGGGVLADGSAWVLGGWGCSTTNRGGSPTKSSWVLRSDQGTWAPAASLPTETSGPTQVAAPDGGFWVVGGFEPAPNNGLFPVAVDHAWSFTP